MFQLTIDTSEIEEAKEKIEADIKRLPSIMRAAVQSAALDERQTHLYQNRTGQLQKSTKGFLAQSTKSVVKAQLTMGMPYASYVEAKGLSNLKERAQEVEELLNAALETMFKT